MHRCLVGRVASRLAARSAPAAFHPSAALGSVRCLSADAAATPAPLPSPIAAANALLSGATGPAAPRRASKKVRKARAPKLVNPLLGRIWRGSGDAGIRGVVSPDDWKNIITLNRQRLLQLKEKEQYRAWKSFQRMKTDRLQFLAERGETPSTEMLTRIAQREEAIMKISAGARAKLNEPIPEQKHQKRVLQNQKGIDGAARALSHPQTYLKTAFPNQSWRVFTFRLTHYHSHLLHKQMEKFREIAKKLGLSPSYPTYLPHRTKRFTIIRGPHVDKTSREQYETRLYSLKINVAPQVEKLWAIQRLSELGFRLINGPVRMRIETPPNVAIETFNFAPNPTKAEMGHTPPQLYASRDSPGIENILYKFDQHQFPFLMDWQEEILDEKLRGIYAAGRDVDNPLPMRADSLADGSEAEEVSEEDDMVFDEEGEFQIEDDLVGEDSEATEQIDIEAEDLSQSELIQDKYNKRIRPLVQRKRKFD